ncbi:MAG: hypothetical protein RR526_04595, partial [Victivallaceae bacterium]
MSYEMNIYGNIRYCAIEPDSGRDDRRDKIGKQSEINAKVSRAFRDAWKSGSNLSMKARSLRSLESKHLEVILSNLNLPWKFNFKLLKKEKEKEKE